MKCSFYLKDSQKRIGKKETLILFTRYFKNENKKFIYSTGERIKPIDWDFKRKRPKGNTIQLLNDFESVFLKVKTQYEIIGEEFTSEVLKREFDLLTKRVKSTGNSFIDAYDQFYKDNLRSRNWTNGTAKRYKCMKKLIENYEKWKGSKLSFSTINDQFYIDFSEYCYSVKDLGTNTFIRYMWLLKAFLNWAVEKNYTYNKAYKKFELPKKAKPDHIALKLDQVEEIFNHNFSNLTLERAKDLFVFQCLTGMRYGELKRVNERTVNNGIIYLKEEKDKSKSIREIPLIAITDYILKKYQYRLPLISNQKQNQYIKEVFKKAQFTFETEYSRNQNKTEHRIVKPFYDRITTHTARRTFITIMKGKGIADKTVMAITGHRNHATFNSYIKPDSESKKDAMQIGFNNLKILKKA